MLIQLVPVLVWLLTPDDVFRITLQGTERGRFSVAGVMAYGLLIGGFAFGSWLSTPRQAMAARREPPAVGRLLAAGHYVALLFATFSSVSVVMIVLASGLDILAVILASQANLFKVTVYGAGVGAQTLIMGRHLVLAALITWFVLAWRNRSRPRTTFLIAGIVSVSFLFTSSRLSVLSLLVVAALFWFSGRAGIRPRRSARNRVWQIAVAASLAVFFAGGVWLRSLRTWSESGGTVSLFIAPVYEATAYLISPVNYSMAFVADAVAFQRGLGLENFFGVVFTVFNLEVDDSFRQLISWSYNPSLNQIGMVGEWFTIAGPLLFVPAILFGYMAGVTYHWFRRGEIAGWLLYPLLLVAIADSARGFLLPQNILAANVLFSMALLATISVARALQLTALPRLTRAA